MSKKHGCPAPGCKNKRQEWALTCKRCWYKVPEDLKGALRSYDPGTSGRRAAAREILRWLMGGQRSLKS